MPKRLITFAFFAAAQLTSAGSVTLPAITFFENAANGNNVGNTSNSPGLLQYVNPGGGVATVTIDSNPTQGLFINAQSTGYTLATGEAIFSIEVSGPENTMATIDISGFTNALFANLTPGSSAILSTVDTLGSPEYFAACAGTSLDENCTGSNVTVGPGPFSLIPVVIPTNTPIEMQVFAGADALDNGGFGTTLNATADPYFQLDPSFVSSNPGYSLDFSPGFFNVQSTVPEPGSSTSALFGVLVLGAAQLWRGRRWLSTIGERLSRTISA